MFLINPCDKCIVKAMCRRTCEKRRKQANGFDDITRTAAFIFVMLLYIGFMSFMIF